MEDFLDISVEEFSESVQNSTADELALLLFSILLFSAHKNAPIWVFMVL